LLAVLLLSEGKEKNQSSPSEKEKMNSSFVIVFMAGIAVVYQLLKLKVLYPTELNKFVVEDIPELSKGMNIAVTGASSGLGFASVKHIFQAGKAKKVFMLCRSADKCNTAKESIRNSLDTPSQTELICILMDLAVRESIIEGAEVLKEQLLADPNDPNSHGALNILINNAGAMGTWSTIEFLEESQVETHVWVNHVAHQLLVHQLFPNLVEGNGRVVSVSSIVALLPFNAQTGWHPKGEAPTISSFLGDVYHLFNAIRYYSKSKRANLQFAAELHRRYNPLITSVAAHPGYTQSALVLRWKFALTNDWIKKWLTTNSFFGMNIEYGALSQLRAALDKTGVPSGSYVGPSLFITGDPTLLGRIAGMTIHHWPFSTEDSEGLWDHTCRTLGINTFGDPFKVKTVK
jgi:NAD(P)-dependent dehydrogenase (short-subunit alcohol dehydrogenase family)